MSWQHNRQALYRLTLLVVGWWLVCSALFCHGSAGLFSQHPSIKAAVHGEHPGHPVINVLEGDVLTPGCCAVAEHQDHDMGEWLKQPNLWLGMMLGALLMWWHQLWSAAATRHRTRPNSVFRLENYPRLHLTLERLLN